MMTINNVLVVIILEANKKCTEHTFFKALGQATWKKAFSEVTGWDQVIVQREGHTKRNNLKMAQRNGFKRTVQDIYKGNDSLSKVQFVMIMDNDVDSISEKDINDLYCREVSEIASWIPGKYNEITSFNYCMLPAGQSFEYFVNCMISRKIPGSICKRDCDTDIKRMMGVDNYKSQFIDWGNRVYDKLKVKFKFKNPVDIFKNLVKNISNDNEYRKFINEAKKNDEKIIGYNDLLQQENEIKEKK